MEPAERTKLLNNDTHSMQLSIRRVTLGPMVALQTSPGDRSDLVTVIQRQKKAVWHSNTKSSSCDDASITKLNHKYNSLLGDLRSSSCQIAATMNKVASFF